MVVFLSFGKVQGFLSVSRPLHSAFTIFKEDRMRLGKVKLENCVFYLPLHSAFIIFVHIYKADIIWNQ